MNALLVLENANRTFDSTNYPFLHQLKKRWLEEKPLQGIRILHNIPVTLETLVKLESLIAAGADLTVTHVDFPGLQPNQAAVDVLTEAKIKFVPQHNQLSGEFDVALDCAAQMIHLNTISIKKGLVELTQTGTQRLKDQTLPFPCISVDDSHTKKLEGMYGTGEAFVRAIKEQSPSCIQDQLFIVFGYGKVGQGICKYLMQETSHIAIVDPEPNKRLLAQKRGLIAIDPNDTETLEKLTTQCFCCVTSTGIPNFLSQTFSQEMFSSTCLFANMGASDEIGDRFNDHHILCNRSPINFSLKHPTLMLYIDPIFYAHNKMAVALVKNAFKKEYHPLPNALDKEIIFQWQGFHKCTLSDIFETD